MTSDRPLVLSVRRPVNRQRVADAVWGDVDALRTVRQAVILIHGYNTPSGHTSAPETDEDAAASYLNWYRAVAAELPGGIWPHDVRVFGFYWPGDVQGVSLAKLKSYASFGHRIGSATLSGERLGACLRHYRPRAVTLVAHSLGCRVALSTLREAPHMQVYGAMPRILGTILMAGAVSESSCRAPIDPLASLDEMPEFAAAALAPGPLSNLHSTEDSILKVAFSAAAALDGDTHPVAIGLEGGPKDRWHQRINTRRKHNEYWPYQWAHKLSAQMIQPAWVRAGSAPRELLDRELPSRRLGIHILESN